MAFAFEGRYSDSPFVDVIWRTESLSAGSFISTAQIHWGMVITTYQGKTTLTVRGPETTATPAPFPAGAEFFGIVFKLGTFMPHLPPKIVMNCNDLNLPEASRGSVWLHGASWEIPTFDNADTFIARLVHDGLIVFDPIVDSVRQGCPPPLSIRTVQYRFQQATGLTHQTIQQIERAQQAVSLLTRGTSILDTVDAAGYYDQAHLTRALRRYMGQTPAQIMRVDQSAQSAQSA
ncbi:MAG: helix-turn-helix transcriptional regulator [Anaerolineae bacterium]|nr:helix-turn-helix transcriptional regulator [Anaerolineae bacterium]